MITSLARIKLHGYSALALHLLSLHVAVKLLYKEHSSGYTLQRFTALRQSDKGLL